MENQNMYMAPMVGYTFVKPQFAEAGKQYPPQSGLAYGTMFPELNKPMEVYGMEDGQEESSWNKI